MANMTIGQAADASRVKVTTIRFYENRGLLDAAPRIAQLRSLEAELARMVRSCHGGDVADCQVIESLSDHARCASDHARA